MSQPQNDASSSPYIFLFTALSRLPLSHYLIFVSFMLIVFLYNFLELHFVRDLLSFFRGDPVCLTYSANSELYQSVVARCQILHERFSPTPWLCSPHLQTVFLSLLGWNPDVTYRRQLFRTRDGGTIALDWLMHSDLKEGSAYVHDSVQQDDKAPIVVVIPGLTSDSSSAYIKHLAFKLASRGWNVVVCNHRGLGGIAVTSDCFYNGGWTEDMREIINNIHCHYPEAPVYAVGTSLGANILVKYLGEEGINVSLNGAAAVCSPWDLLICDRFINRRLAQKFYNRVLAVGAQAYAELHHSVMSRLVDWEGVTKARSVREFDDCVTRVLGKFETVDTFYRRASCVNIIGNVSLPLLCISSLDDPVCTREAIPWDECRLNENIVLATTKHGGHLAYYEGMNANSIWWVRALDEFFHVLDSSERGIKKKMKTPSPLETSIDRGPFVNVMEDGMVTAVGNIQTEKAAEDSHKEDKDSVEKQDAICDGDMSNQTSEKRSKYMRKQPTETENAAEDLHVEDRDSIEKGDAISDGDMSNQMPKKHSKDMPKQRTDKDLVDLRTPIRKLADQLSRRSRNSIWLLAYIAIVTTWPLLGSSIRFFKKKFNLITPEASVRR